uniref:Solute carrier family 2, facilitated glucose transporter member 5 n=1 Tax=Cyprinus carpio TaxID=7962 RepID=A0A8C2BJQ1_CYPCA
MVTSTAIGGTLQYGYNLFSVLCSFLQFIQNFVNETYMERWGIQLGVYEVTLIWTFMVSIFSLGSFIGALIAGPMSVRFGRKKTMLLNNVFLFSSSLLALLSRTAKSFEMIIISRFLVGINAGISMNVPMYFGESAPKHLRGAVSLSSTVFTSFGLVLGQVLLGSEPYWQYLFASNAIPGLIQFLTFPWFPENPRYLLIDWRQRALQRLQGCEVQREELDEILQEQNETKGERAKQPWELFTDCSICWQLITVAVLSSAMQLCGNDSVRPCLCPVLFYASYVFQEAGISGGQIQYVTIGTGVCEFTTCILCVSLPYICYQLCNSPRTNMGKHLTHFPTCIVMTCIFTYILSFGLGPAGVTGILPTEIFNQTTRPGVYMAAGSLMWLNLFIIGMIFSFLVSGLGQYCFLPFGAVCLLTASYIQKVLPETKGKTLSMITKEFYRLSYCGQVKMDPEGKQAQYQLGEIFHSTAL